MWRFKRRWRPSARTVKRLQQLAKELGLPRPHTYERLHPGHWQRSSGAWVWVAQAEDGLHLFGSCDSLMTCLRNGCLISDHKMCPELYAKKTKRENR